MAVLVSPRPGAGYAKLRKVPRCFIADWTRTATYQLRTAFCSVSQLALCAAYGVQGHQTAYGTGDSEDGSETGQRSSAAQKTNRPQWDGPAPRVPPGPYRCKTNSPPGP